MHGKKVFGIICALLLVLLLAVSLAACDSEEPEVYTEGLAFIKTDDGFAVAGYVGTDYDVVIPSVYEGEPVTSIEDSAFEGCETLLSVVIPASVKEIGSSAFAGCTALTKADIPQGVTEIGAYAFFDCELLRSINIPDGVTQVGYAAFSSCAGLVEVSIGKNVERIDRDAFYGCFNLVTVEYRGTRAEWNMIEIDEEWSLMCKFKYVECQDGSIYIYRS